MKKNKIISIFLLLITILLSIGLGMCIKKSENKQESFTTKLENQYLTYKNIQQLMQFTFLLSNDPTDIEPNIYTVISNSAYYSEYLNNIDYPLSKIDNYYPLAQFLYPEKTKTLESPINNMVSLSRLPYINPFITYDADTKTNTYKIKTDSDFKTFINTLYPESKDTYGPLIPHNDLITNSQNFMTNLVKHYQTFQEDYLTAVADTYTANLLELLEILYVSTIVPHALYNMYILPYNYVIDMYPLTFTDSDSGLQDCTSTAAVLCNTNSYTMFIQLVQSAMQMQLSINKLVDKDGNRIKGVDFTNSKLSDIRAHFKNMMYMFDGKDPGYLLDLVHGLEPSYILFYNALYYFHVKLNWNVN